MTASGFSPEPTAESHRTTFPEDRDREDRDREDGDRDRDGHRD